jgi:hypothetical protein
VESKISLTPQLSRDKNVLLHVVFVVGPLEQNDGGGVVAATIVGAGVALAVVGAGVALAVVTTGVDPDEVTTGVDPDEVTTGVDTDEVTTGVDPDEVEPGVIIGAVVGAVGWKSEFIGTGDW